MEQRRKRKNHEALRLNASIAAAGSRRNGRAYREKKGKWNPFLTQTCEEWKEIGDRGGVALSILERGCAATCATRKATVLAAPHGKMPARDFDEQKHNFWIAKVCADFHLDDGHFPFLCVAYHQFVYRL
jgi:hypothetical protein